MANFEQWINQDLQDPVQAVYSQSLAFSSDPDSILVGVHVTDGGEPAALSGNVVAHVIRSADGGTVSFGGTLSGSDVSAVLPAACFAYPGQIAVMLQLVNGTTKTTLCKALYSVVQGETGTPIDPGSVVPDLDDLLAMLDEMAQATDAAEAAAAAVPAIIAPTFSASAAYTAGRYVYYNGALYRFTDDHAAGAWVGTDAVSVQLAPEVADLKSAIDEVTLDKAGTNINNCGYEGGYIASNGTDTTASSYESVAFRSSGYIPVIGGETLYWWGKLSDGVALGANAVIVEYDSSKNLIGTRNAFDKYGTTGTNQAFTTSQNAAYVRIALYQGVTDKSTIQIALYYSGDEQAAFIPYQNDKVLNYNKVYTAGGESLDDVIDDKIAAIGFSPIYELQSITVTGESGALMSNGSVTETTDVTRYKIPVLAGEKYVVSARHGYAYRAFLVLDSDSNILSYFPTTTSGTAIHRNVEVNISEDGFLVVQNVYNFPPYIGKAVSVDFNDKLYQKSIYWNGDSICYGAGGFSFANQIGLIHAMPETMDAVSGTRLSTRTGRTDSIYDRVVAMGTTAEYDFIGIEGGYNDYFSSVPIGTLMSNYTDTPDTTTVIGAVEGICKHIRTNFPNSKFFFVLGHRPIAVGAYPTDVDTYWDAIITALNKWAVPYVDIRKDGTLMAYNSDWLADYFGQGETMGTHPNTEGYTKFYNPLVEDRMKSL